MAQVPDFKKIISGSDPSGIAEKPDFASIVKANAGVPPSPESADQEGFVRTKPLKNIPARLQMSLVRKADKEAELQRKREIIRNIPGFSNSELYLYPPAGNKPGVLTYKVNRDDPNEKEKLVDAPMDKSWRLSELAADTVEALGGDMGAIFGEGVALKTRLKGLGRLAEKMPGPAGRPIKLFTDIYDASPITRIGAGAFAGDVAQSEVERAAGLVDMGRGQQSIEAMGQAALGMFGGFVTDRLGAPLKGLATGEGMAKKTRFGAKAQASTEALGLPLLPVNLVASSPILQKLGGQAGALTTTLREYVDNLELANSATFDRFAKLPFKDPQFPTLDYLEKVHRNEVRRITQKGLDYARRQGKFGSRTSTTEAGKAFKKAVADYDLYATSRVNRAYARARQIAEPQFDLTNLKAKAREIRRGMTAPMRGETVQSRIVMPNGMPAGTIQLPGSDKRISMINRDVDRVIDDILKLDFSQPTKASKTDILRRYGQELHDAMLPPAGAPAFEVKRADYNDAQALFGAIQETLKNVTNADPRFTKEWHRAHKLAQQRFKDNESMLFMEAAKSETPTALASRLTDLNDPKTTDNWDLIERTVANARSPAEAKKYIDMVRGSVVSDLLADPKNLSQKLENAHPSVFKGVRQQGITRPGLLRPKDVAVLKDAAKQFDRLYDVGIQQTLKRQTDIGVAINELASNGHTAAIDYLKHLVKQNGGENGPLHRMLSAGMVKDLYSRSLDLQQAPGFMEGGRTNFLKMMNEEVKFRRTGAIDLMTKKDRELLENIRTVQDVLRLRSDAGTSLQAAEAVAQMRGGVMQGLRTVAENVGIAYMFTTPGGIKRITGETASRKPIGDLGRWAGAVAAQAVGDAEATGELMAQTAGFLASLPGMAVEKVRETVGAE